MSHSLPIRDYNRLLLNFRDWSLLYQKKFLHTATKTCIFGSNSDTGLCNLSINHLKKYFSTAEIPEFPTCSVRRALLVDFEKYPNCFLEWMSQGRVFTECGVNLDVQW